MVLAGGAKHRAKRYAWSLTVLTRHGWLTDRGERGWQADLSIRVPKTTLFRVFRF